MPPESLVRLDLRCESTTFYSCATVAARVTGLAADFVTSRGRRGEKTTTKRQHQHAKTRICHSAWVVALDCIVSHPYSHGQSFCGGWRPRVASSYMGQRWICGEGLCLGHQYLQEGRKLLIFHTAYYLSYLSWASSTSSAPLGTHRHQAQSRHPT